MITWIRRPGYADSRHLRGQPSEYAAARGLAAGACGSTFGDEVLTWQEEDPPVERDGCAVCQAAYRAQDGPIPLETRLRPHTLKALRRTACAG